MDTNVVLCGDAIIEMQKIPDNSIDLIFADPPYWMRVNGVLKRVEGTDYDGCDDHWDNQFTHIEDYNSFSEKWLTECRRILKPNGSFWVIGSMQCIYCIGAIMQKIGFWFVNDVVWHKKNPTPNFLGARLNNSHETLIWATKSEKSKFTFHYKTAKELNTDTVDEQKYLAGERKQMGSVWRIGLCQGNERIKDAQGKKLHSTQKPEELLRRVIAISSNIGDIVLDPFGGTMTTGAVAKRMGRRYIMIEKEAEYCRYGQRRIDETQQEIGPVERADFDQKPIRATIAEMIGAQCFTPGERFYMKNSGESGELTPDGRLIYNGEVMDIHTCAAAARKRSADRLNGFDFWYVLREGKLVSIKKIREDYRKEKGM